jgi:hypothetical protein
MAMLTKLEQKLHARDFETVEARRVSGNFDAFVEIVSAGGEGIDDFLLARAEAHEGFAEILEVAGRHTEALEQLRAAADLYEEKGVLIPANALRARLAAPSV